MLNAESTTKPSTIKKDKGLRALLRELSDDEDDPMTGSGLDIPYDPRRPWLRDYRAYMDVFEQVPEGWTVIKWWGVRISVLIYLRETNRTS